MPLTAPPFAPHDSLILSPTTPPRRTEGRVSLPLTAPSFAPHDSLILSPTIPPRTLELDKARGTVRVQAGVKLADLHEWLGEQV